MTVYDAKLASVLELDAAGADVVAGDIRTIVGLARKARRDGLLALDEDAQTATPGLLRLGLRLVVDGADPDVVQRTCRIAIHADGFEGVELVRRLVLLDGVLGIQAGENPTQLAAQLSAYLGEEAALAASE